MDFSINLDTIVQGFLAASMLWYARSIREVVTIVKLHQWRIEKLEEVQKEVSTKCPV